MSKKNKNLNKIKSLFEEFNLEIENTSLENIINIKLKYINKLIAIYKNDLHKSIEERVDEMKGDYNKHFIMYKLLGIKDEEHKLIDLYQNIGRFVFKYAGALIEDIAVIALGGKEIKFKNNISSTPKVFQIDCYTYGDNKAHEIKWRDATTDGDHTKKEENKIKGILMNGYIPVKIMFFMPERKQAQKIQYKIIKLYKQSGEAYIEEDAFNYISKYSGIDMLSIFNKFIEEENQELIGFNQYYKD